MKIAARAIIINNDEILLVRHHGRDFYSLPGGKIDPDEGIRSAVKREIFEELGISPVVERLSFVHEFKYPKGDLSLEFFFLVSNGEMFRGELKGEYAEAELAEIAWIPLKHLGDDFAVKPAFLCNKLNNQSLKNTIEYNSDLGE
jgi:mutator protein MutT